MVGEGTGTFVVSIDLEMSWGAVHHGRPHDESPYLREREVVDDVLELMERYEISATWAVVGHLFLRECTAPDDGPPHPGITRPDYPWLVGDWYDLDPVSDVQLAPTWYGPDLVERIASCPTPQEIASHSFAHVIAGDPGCSREAFAADVQEAVDVARARGFELRSFVYPRNSIAHLDVLEDAGFTSFRGPTPSPDPAGARALRRLRAVAEKIRPTARFSPERHDGLVNIPHTYLFDPGSRNARLLGTAGWSRLVERRLHHAVRSKSLFHLWFHSHNLAVDLDRSNRAMERLFRSARRAIDAGRLTNPTMAELAASWPEGERA